MAGLRRLYLPPFRVDLEIRPGVRPPIAGLALARELRAGLQAGGAPEPAAVGLILADDQELARLNGAHLGHRGPTDVLSFPLLPPSAFPEHPGRSPAVGDGKTRSRGRDGVAFLLPPGTRLHLGDVVISVERATVQAAAGHGGQTGDVQSAPADELRLLAIHGALHLCGWDHAAPDEERAMRALEREVLAGTGR